MSKEEHYEAADNWIANLEDQLHEANTKIQSLQKEVERLRGALERITKIDPSHPCGNYAVTLAKQTLEGE